MKLNYSNEDLRGKRFNAITLYNASFRGADLRGADFTSAKLIGADFSQSKSGIQYHFQALLFVLGFLVACFSGYLAMLAGNTVQLLLKADNQNERIVGYITCLLFVVFAAFAVWKGLFTAINKLLVIMISSAVALGAFMYFSGLGTGIGALYGGIALLLMVLMFVVGTIARATIGTLGSNILFFVVAISGGMFGRSMGGGIGTVVMAVCCAVISKRALKSEGNSILRTIALFISSRFGTSFKNADLTNGNFTDARINNTDFSHANLAGVTWTNAQKQFTLETHE
jgi:uncharacterized protein YjbI with pentapeptide repeats